VLPTFVLVDISQYQLSGWVLCNNQYVPVARSSRQSAICCHWHEHWPYNRQHPKGQACGITWSFRL